jgi:outer membrane protein OmpA-like peptidoglycan-associated protein
VAASREGGEVIEETQDRITEQEARSSDEAFSTSAAGQEANRQAARADDDDDDLLKALGTAAAVGLGAYAVGELLDGGGRVVSNTGERVVVEKEGRYRVLKDDDALLRRPGSAVRTQTYADGSTRTVVTAPDGTRTITIRSKFGRVLRRVRVLTDGRRVVLFDDTAAHADVDVQALPAPDARRYEYTSAGDDSLRQALLAVQGQGVQRDFSLYQIRQIDAVRYQVPVITLDAINFETDSAVIQPREAQDLSALGNAMRDAIDRDPGQVFLVEGHTDTVGGAAYNLALSDRRAESVALALTEYFNVPPANMVVQGYGESDLKVERRGDIRANRRAAVRNITPLLRGGS